MHKIVMRLEVHPEFGLHSEKHSQPRSGIGRDRALARHDLWSRIVPTDMTAAGKGSCGFRRQAKSDAANTGNLRQMRQKTWPGLRYRIVLK
jgi:hypothetical protein